MFHGIFFKTEPSPEVRHTVEAIFKKSVTRLSHSEMTSIDMKRCYLAQSTPSIHQIGTPICAVIVMWGQLYNADEIANQLSIPPQEQSSLNHADLILRCYMQYGEECTKNFRGDFSFAIYDKRTERLFCVRDQMGIKPFYYYDNEHYFIFSHSLHLFHQLPFITVKPYLEWSCRYLLNISLPMDFEKTAYQSLFKIPPAHFLNVTAKIITKKRYFTFHTNKIALKTSNDYIDFYRTHLHDAVKRRVQVQHPLGSELSGGIDSSTVTSLAAQYYPGSLDHLHTFAFARLANEPQHILSVSQYLGLPMTHISCSPPVPYQQSLTALNALGGPVQHGNASHHEIFYKLAQQQGVQTLLSGFGGDEFVTSLHTALYLHELLHDKQYLTLLRNVQGNPLFKMLRFMKLIAKHHRKPGIQDKSMMEAFAKRWPDHIVEPRLVEQYALQAAYEEIGRHVYGYQNLDQFTLQNRLAPFISTRTEECTLVAHQYGIEYRWPLLDTQLIQCFLSIPTREKYRPGISRFLHKQAINNCVPANITSQNTKYMGEKAFHQKPQGYQLNADLHPELLKIINQEKLLSQEKHLSYIAQYQPQAFYAPEYTFLRITLQRVNQLDLWLKTYYPQQCNWAI